MPLTLKQVARLTERGRYFDERGLYLQITKKGVRSWLLRYERGGRKRWMGLGPVDDFSLEEARERARRARQLLADGIDPIEHRKAGRAQQTTEAALAAAKNITFQEAAERYYKFHSPKWSNPKHRAQFLSTLKTYAYPVIGKLPVRAIDTPLVIKVIEPIWEKKTETASRVRGRIENVLDYAKVSGWRDGENPAAWNGNLEHALPAPGTFAKVKHHAALPFTDIPDFLAELREREGIAARALEFLILTAARTGETIFATWDEIDLREKTWTVPAERMKAKKEHRVPLCARAIEILKALPREAKFLFPGSQEAAPLSNMALLKLLQRMGRDDVTAHGFRSTFRDWAAERTNYPNHLLEMALGHTVGDKVEAAYRRGDLFDKRRKLMTDWERYCATKPVATGNNVTPITQARGAR